MRQEGRDFVVERRRRRAMTAGGRLADADLREGAARAAGRGVMHLDVAVGGRPGGRGSFAGDERHDVDDGCFASRQERSRYLLLRLREKARQITALAVQPAWRIHVEGHYFRTYIASFAYFDLERNRSVIEDVVGPGTDAVHRLIREVAEMAHDIRVEEVAS